MGLRGTHLLVCALYVCQASTYRTKRQAPDYKSEDTVEDYAGNEHETDPDYVESNDKHDAITPANDSGTDGADGTDGTDGTDEDENVADYVGDLGKDTKEESKDTSLDTSNDNYKGLSNNNAYNGLSNNNAYNGLSNNDAYNGLNNNNNRYQGLTNNNPYRSGNNDINEDRFGDDNPPDEKSEDSDDDDDSSEHSSKHKKHSKKSKYLKRALKKVTDFLKKVLDPNKLMENAYVTEMLRRFSDQETEEVESHESEEHHEHIAHHEIPVPKKTKKRRGRPRKKDKTSPGIAGLIKKGIMSLTQMEVDQKKLKRRVRLIKRIARKAKRPLKTAVKIFLSSRNQGMGGGYGGGGGYGVNY